MSVHTIIKCEGVWPGEPTMPCTGKYPVPVADHLLARQIAGEHGWGSTPHGRDLCPAHVRRLTNRRSV